MKIALRVILLFAVSAFLALPAVAEEEPKKEGGADVAAEDVKKDEVKPDKKKGDKKDAQAKKERREKKADKANKVAKANKKQKPDRAQVKQLSVFELPKSVELTAEQRDKIEHLKKEYVPKLAAADAKVKEAVPAEKRKAMHVAVKTARGEGKKGKELRVSVEATANLTAEEKEALKAAHKQHRELRQEVQAAIHGVLTQEQVAQLPQAKKGDKKEKKNKSKV